MKRGSGPAAEHAPAGAASRAATREPRPADASRSALDMQSALGNRTTASLLEMPRLPADAGEPLDRRVRLLMEAAYGRRFDAVRVHARGEANHAARSLGAKAFAVGPHLYFGTARYTPRTASGLRLLGHELAHVVQQGAGASHAVAASPQVLRAPRLEREADDAAGAVMAGNAATATFSPAVAAGAVQCSPESELISANTSFGNLDEETLGKLLLQRALRSEHEFVHRVLNELGRTDRDDVCYEFANAASDKDLTALRESESGRRLLDRIYDELTAGKPGEEEMRQADRVLKEKAQVTAWAGVEKGLLNAKIFPFRLGGIFKPGAAPIHAQRRPKGRILVKMPTHVMFNDRYRREVPTLPEQVFTTGYELPEDEIVGVKMYDLGGEVHYRPALYLVQLSNETTTNTFEKMAETAGLGLSLGTMGMAAAGAGRAAQVLMWADRIAFGVGTITSILRDHRGWIIEKFGDNGREFLRYVDMVNAVVALYGGARALVGMGQLLAGLASSINRWRKSVGAATDLAEAEKSVLDAATKHVEDVQDDVNKLQKAGTGKPGAGAASEGTATTGTKAPAESPKATETPTTPVLDEAKVPPKTDKPQVPPKTDEPQVPPKVGEGAGSTKAPVVTTPPRQPSPAVQARIDEARVALAKAQGDLTAAKTLAAEAGAGNKDAKAFLKEAEKAVEQAEQHLRSMQRIAQRESIELEIADLNRQIDDVLFKRKPRPPGAEPRTAGVEPASASAEGKELAALRAQVKQRMDKVRQTQDDWMDTLRAATPQRGPEGGVKRALENMDTIAPQLRTGKGPIDVTSPHGAPIEPPISPDHIYPVDKIFKIKEFEELTPAQQLRVLEMTENYFPLSLRAQFSKGNRTMAEWFKTSIGGEVPKHLRPLLLDAERRAEQAVRALIRELAAKK